MSLEDGVVLLGASDLARADDVSSPAAFFGSASSDLFAPAHADRPTSDGKAASHWAGRTFDMLFALVILAAVAPVLILLIVALQIDSPGPVFFIQRRVGRNGALFPCVKLRTMVVDARQRLERLLESSPEAREEWQRDHKLRDDPRVTRLGRFARLFSLDELPQLLNIVAGHMSIVGPRPIVEEEIWRYGPLFADYCSVRPGLTGLWQVSGRNNTTYQERVRLDSEYAQRKSMSLDLSIMARTLAVVVFARGAY